MAHPMAGQCTTGQERANARFADGGPVDDASMTRAKAALRGDMGMATKGSWINRTGAWTPKTGQEAQDMADSIRGQKKDD